MSKQVNTGLKIVTKARDALTIQSFLVLRDLETVTYGKETISLHPKVEHDWALGKKVHVFTTNKASLENLTLDAKVKLYLMGEQLGSSLLVQVSIQEWLNCIHKKTIDQVNLTVLLCHDSIGNLKKYCPLNDKLMSYSTRLNCCLDNITYTLVKASIDMSNLDLSQKPSFPVYH
eukprot:15333468-Ditylum_brightwellii.AAC.1